MASYSSLSDSIRDALTLIEPTHDGDMIYFPCRAVLEDGRILDNICLMAAELYPRYQGFEHEETESNGFLRLETIARVEASPMRLPAKYANELYRGGESGMGYFIFTVVYNDGSRQAFVTDSAVDFVPYPQGKKASDIAAVLRSEGRNDPSLIKLPQRYWCFYSK